jgi:hypothetical protein
MAFRISGLSRSQFRDLFSLEDGELAVIGARRTIADKKPGFPCRVSLADAELGERVILLPFPHQTAPSPYQASGPIFVREIAEDVSLPPDTIPNMLRSRLLSIRAYDSQGFMVDAQVVGGDELDGLLSGVLTMPGVSYAHVHFARPGCYACRVDNVNS